MNQKTFIVNSLPALAGFITLATELFKREKYVTFTWRLGEKRSLSQNKLMHLWATEYAAHLLDKHKKSVTKGELEGMKRHAKKEYYLETGEPWLVHEVVNPKTGETKKDFTSSADWKVGELFQFMTWLQMKAALDGCILESKGEYAENIRRQNG